MPGLTHRPEGRILAPMNDYIKCEDDGPVWRVTLNRPNKANALTFAMLSELAEILERCAHAKDLRALHLTGAGERVFSAGADLTEIGKGAGETYFRMWETVASALSNLPVLTIAALNGATMGGGLVLAMSCDLRVSAGHARFAYPILKNGITPGAAQANRLRALIGPSRASLLVLGAARIEAKEALSWGLIDQISEDPMAEAQSLSDAALSADPAHLARLKRLMSQEETTP